MPRLSYPGGRKAAASVELPKPEDEIEIKDDAVLEDGVLTPEDPTVALKARIAELEQANATHAAAIETERRRAEEASKQVKDRDAEVTRLQHDTYQSQSEAIEAALSAAQAEVETAQRDMESAIQLGDFKAQAEASRRMSKADARILQYEAGKEALGRQIEEAKRQAEIKPEVKFNDPLANIDLPPLAKDWLRNHTDYLYDQEKNAEIQHLHWKVVKEGYAPYSKDYFEVLEQKLGLRQAPKKLEPFIEEDDDVEEPPRRAVVSAPPSREVPSSSGSRDGRIRLTAAQKEAAKIAGITEAEYAQQLIKLNQEKQSGNYGGPP